MKNSVGHILEYVVVSLILLSMGNMSLSAQNNPYVDDRLVHFGFHLGLNFMSFNVQETDSITQSAIGDRTIYHARVQSLTPGFSVGFITDVRLSRHLNLRCTPALHFGQKTITYRSFQRPDSLIHGTSTGNRATVLSLPISIPLYLKWSAEREVNYRPYVIAGGGVSFDLGRDKERVIYQKFFDYFVEVGFGCDFYFQWFKFCPEIKYQIGFANVLTPISEADQAQWKVPVADYFYSNTISRLTNQMISIVFNFE